MGKDDKGRREAIEEIMDLSEEVTAPSTGDEQTVVDDVYLRDLRARLEGSPSAPPGDGPVEAGESTRRPGYADVSTEKLEAETRSRPDRRAQAATCPMPAPAFRGDSVYVLCGPDAGRTFLIVGDKVRVGRGPDNDVVLRDSSISRHHVKLTRAVDGWLFEDLGSENGTYIDGEFTATGKVALGQPLEIGRTIVIIERGRER